MTKLLFDKQKLHDDYQARATTIYIAGLINGYRLAKPDMTVEDVLDLLQKMNDSYRDSLHKNLLGDTND
jgi:hypothetical protein